MRISDWRSDVCASDRDSDGLTGVSNHRHIHAQLAGLVHSARSHGRPLALLFMDLDRFKQFNDRHGHPAGDRVLRVSAARSEEHTSELQSLMRISYAVFCLKKKKNKITTLVTRHKRKNTM